MRKITIAILVAFLILSFFMQITLNKKINYLQAEIKSIQEDYSLFVMEMRQNISSATPLTSRELIIIQENMTLLNDFFGSQSELPAVIAQQLFILERSKKIETASISQIKKHTKPYISYEIITLDDEHYWFTFLANTSTISSILKGVDKESVIFAAVDD